MSITTSAILAELNISVWTAAVVDRDASASVTTGANAISAAAQVRKNLMAGTTLRKKIADYAAGCRTWHLRMTMPWSDKGVRLLPMSLFLDYKSESNTRQATFNAMVDELIAEYPTLVQQQAANLGALFNAAEYPTAHEIKDKFGYKLVFSPVPEAGDFRIDINATDLEDIKRSYEESFNARLADAMRTPWEQLHRLVAGMADKLDDDAEGPNRRYHDSFLSNAHELCAMLTHLNITKDPELETARRKLEHAIAGVDIEDIRGDGAARASTKARLDDLLRSYEW